MSEDNVYKLIELMNDRITDLGASYKILNDNHHFLKTEFIELRTMVKTSVSIVKWVISPISLILLIIKLLEIWNMI